MGDAELLLKRASAVESGFAIHAALVAIWVFFSLVYGFSIYAIKDPLELRAPVNAVSHLGWWFLLELFASWFLARAAKFHLVLVAGGARPQLSVQRASNELIFAMFLVILTMIANAVQFSLVIVEWTYCISTLCVDRFGFMIAFFVLLLALVVFKCIIMYWLYKYYKDMERVLDADPRLFDMPLGPSSGGDVEAPRPSAPQAAAPIGARLATPLLRAARGRK